MSARAFSVHARFDEPDSLDEDSDAECAVTTAATPSTPRAKTESPSIVTTPPSVPSVRSWTVTVGQTFAAEAELVTVMGATISVAGERAPTMRSDTPSGPGLRTTCAARLSQSCQAEVFAIQLWPTAVWTIQSIQLAHTCSNRPIVKRPRDSAIASPVSDDDDDEPPVRRQRRGQRLGMLEDQPDETFLPSDGDEPVSDDDCAGAVSEADEDSVLGKRTTTRPPSTITCSISKDDTFGSGDLARAAIVADAAADGHSWKPRSSIRRKEDRLNTARFGCNREDCPFAVNLVETKAGSWRVSTLKAHDPVAHRGPAPPTRNRRTKTEIEAARAASSDGPARKPKYKRPTSTKQRANPKPAVNTSRGASVKAIKPGTPSSGPALAPPPPMTPISLPPPTPAPPVVAVEAALALPLAEWLSSLSPVLAPLAEPLIAVGIARPADLVACQLVELAEILKLDAFVTLTQLQRIILLNRVTPLLSC